MGHRNLKPSIFRSLTPIVNTDSFWVLYRPRLYLPARPRLYFPALPRARISHQQRSLHTTNPCAADSILDLSNLSISRESRFLAKTHGRPRTQFSPHLELIRSSEVDPFTERAPKGGETVYNDGTKREYSRGPSGKPASMADTLEELARTRGARESAERKVEELQSKIARREREGGVLVIVTMALFLGLVFRDQVRNTMSKSMLRRAWATVTLLVERDCAGSLDDLGDLSRNRDSSSSAWDDAVVSASAKEHGYKSAASRLLWAS